MLNATPMTTANAPTHLAHAVPHPHPEAVPRTAHKALHRVTPAQEINKQYNLFYANFQLVEASYVRALNQQNSSTTTASTTLTAPYSAGSVTLQVADAGIFGPEGSFPSPVTATAMVGAVSVGTFTLTGSSGNLVTVDTTQSSAVSLGQGTTLTAQVSTSAGTSAQAIFPTYITTSAQQLAFNLVGYFNSLPIKLPRMYAPPHQPQRAGAIQQYVYQLVAGGGPLSLSSMLSAISLPQTSSGDLKIYDATVNSAIQSSRMQMLSDVQQIFAGTLPVIPTTSSNGSTTTTGTSSGSTSGTGSTTRVA
jgi:hypothetical protein